MKLNFKQFKVLLFESMLDEDKSRLIDRLVLPDIEDEEEKQKAREEMKAFFKKYNTWENKLDWNKLNTITYADFEKIKDQATQTKGAQKREIADGNIQSIFKSKDDRKFQIMGESKNWLFVAPLTWEAAVYCDSSENQGAGAKWCIGYEKDESYWNDYFIDNGSLFIMAFNKNYRTLNQEELQTNLKYMLEYTYRKGLNVWNQADEKTSRTTMFDIPKTEIIKMFETLKKQLSEEDKKIKELNKLKLEKKIELLKTISEIPYEYFYSCSVKEKHKFTSIVIPDNIKKISNKAFDNCFNLQSVSIPDSVVEIGKKAFAYTNIESIKLPSKMVRISKETFNTCTELQSVIIPENIKVIEPLAFYNCWKLENITLPKNLEVIGDGAFQECKNLKSIVIPKSVKTIGEYAFLYCKNLKEIIFEGRTLDEIKSMDNFKTWKSSNIQKIIKPGK